MKPFEMDARLIVILLLMDVLKHTDGLFGANLCFETQNYTLTTRVKYQQPVSVKTYTWCFDIPPKCSSVHTEMRDKWKVQTEQRSKTIQFCCPGFAENDEQCAPKCEEGSTGENCDEDCPENSWGRSCIQECQCPDNSQCDSKNGKCICHDGWVGPRCNIPKDAFTKRPFIMTPFNRETKFLFDWSSPTQTTDIRSKINDQNLKLVNKTYYGTEKTFIAYTSPPIEIQPQNVTTKTISIQTNKITQKSSLKDVVVISTTPIIPTTNQIENKETITETTTYNTPSSVMTTTDPTSTTESVNATTSQFTQRLTTIISTTLNQTSYSEEFTESPIVQNTSKSQIESPETTINSVTTDSPITLIFNTPPKTTTKETVKPTERSIISLTVLKSTTSTVRRKPGKTLHPSQVNVTMQGNLNYKTGTSGTVSPASSNSKTRKYTNDSRMITIPVKVIMDTGKPIIRIMKGNSTKILHRMSTSTQPSIYFKKEHTNLVTPFSLKNVTTLSMTTIDIQTEETKHVLTEPEQITAVAGDDDPNERKDNLYSVLSIAAGVAAALILMAAIIVLIARFRRNHSGRSKNTDMARVNSMLNVSEDEISSGYLRSVFHSPLPDPPTNMSHYSTLAECKTRYGAPYLQPVVIHTVSPIMMESFREILECHYDRPKPLRPTSFSPVSKNLTYNILPSNVPGMNTLPKAYDLSLSTYKTDAAFPVTDAAINALKLESHKNVEIEDVEPLYDEIPSWHPAVVDTSKIINTGDEAVTEL